MGISRRKILHGSIADFAAGDAIGEIEVCVAEKIEQGEQMRRAKWGRIVAAGVLLMGAGCGCFGQTAVANAPANAAAVNVTVVAQSPAETKTELQIFCLFAAGSGNLLNGSLAETNQKLHGLLEQVRKPGLFNGELGETILLMPGEGMLGAKRVLIIGLGDAASFTPARMYLVGKIAWREANRLGVEHPYFAPTILDGGVTVFATGEVAEQVVHGFRDALAAEEVLRSGGAAGDLAVKDFVYLAGAKHAGDTQEGIDRANRVKAATH
jgi:hypothetical protein